MREILPPLLLVMAAVAGVAQDEATTKPAPPAQGKAAAANPIQSGDFRWIVGPPLLGPAPRPADPCHSIKDPTVVFWKGRWHLFCTIRSKVRSHQIEYLSFKDWNDIGKAERHVLTLTDGYFCAPQVFYFTPHQRWCLVYQVIDKSRQPALQPAFSTTQDLADPKSWSKPALLFERSPDNVPRWIDFWVICDETRAHLFFTSLDGRMWRAETKLADFPRGWSKPAVVLQGDIFEASHTYRLKGLDRYLTVVEAQAGSRRYYKAYVADRLDAKWQPLAATRAKPFAAPVNVRHTGDHWTDSISHGELLRAGHDEHLDVDPAKLRFLFQGVADAAQKGKKYGEIPYRLGLLEAVP
ncbi:MAG: hypothetical protein L0Y71_14605 [Gemmataceae bacterium]|nr:hypothetical protein [Gemmataceae bacterium]